MAGAGIELNLPDLPEVPIRLGADPDSENPEQTRRRRAPLGARLREALTAYLPLLLMVLLALGTWWLVKISPQPTKLESQRAAPGEPDYTLRGFGLQRFAADGSLQLTLLGRQLHHFPENDRLEIEEVRLVSDGSQAPSTVATARQAVSDGKATHVELRGGAQIRSTTPQGEPLEIDSDFLQIQTDLQRISTDKPVFLRIGAQTVKAGGLVWNHQVGQLELKAPVRVVLQPSPTKAP